MDIAYAAGGAVATIGAVGIMFRWLNNKIDKKQDIRLCRQIYKDIKENLTDVKTSQAKTIDAQTQVQVDVGRILQELKHLNGSK